MITGDAGVGSDRAEALLSPLEVTAAQERDTCLVLAGRMLEHADPDVRLREWLEALGLIAYEPAVPAKRHWGQASGSAVR